MLDEPSVPADSTIELLSDAVGALGSDAVNGRLLVGRIGGEDGGVWIGSSLSPRGQGGWEITTVWVYADPAVAEEAEPRLREVLDGESRMGDLMANDPSSSLTRDHGTLTVRGRLVGQPSNWYRLLNILDPALLFAPGP